MTKDYRPKLRFDSSWDDGYVFDRELSDLLKKFNLPGTFYIPGAGGEFPLNASLVKKLVEDGFEIGGHTVSHPQDMKMLSEEMMVPEILNNKKALEILSGQEIKKFCYPRGRFDERVIKVLKQLGFTSARTTKVLQTLVDDPFRTPTAIHVYQRQEYGDMDWVEAANIMVDQAIRTNGIFHIWGHSWEINRDNNWDKLEKFFEWLTDNYEIVKV